jgi:enolase
MAKIKSIKARQLLDSRGNPTIEAEVLLDSGAIARALVPSGASTGTREALELRDGDKKKYLGKSVLVPIANIHNFIAPKLIGMSVFDQVKIDQLMIEIDGTENKSKLGANAMLAVSLAAARAGSMAKNISLYRYLRDVLHAPTFQSGFTLPAPLMNIINGGAHASNNMDIQEFMIVPHLKKSFSENLRAGVEIFHHLKKVLSDKGHSTNVGDEGGFAPTLKNHKEALDLILIAIEKAGYRAGEEISLALDVAASEFFEDGSYQFEGKKTSSQEMIGYYQDLCANYPLYSIEDGLSEQDQKSWPELTKVLGGKHLIVGDDLFVTNKKILERGIKNKEANAILVKVNQIGTLTETFETMKLGFENEIKSIISHRSGETADSFIADLAVATSAGHIKTGSASRSDRIEKYNQLLRIEEELGSDAKFYVIPTL